VRLPHAGTPAPRISANMRGMSIPMPTRRGLRLGSGLVLFAYIAAHLANHALGLASVAAAEHGLNLALRVWHSVPGTVLLYGAAATHVALALNALYLRRTLRMPPLEVLRIALGLGIPILLIGHAVATRLAWEAYRLSPEYTRIVWALWQSDSEGRQLALLVPGWLHGCLGVNFAFGRRAWYQRARPLFFALALLLPVLGALGFLAMGKELAADVANRAFLDSNSDVDAATRIALARTRDTLLALWFALIGSVFVAREVRAFVERRRNTAIAIAYPQRVAHVPAGWSVLEASRSHHVPHVSMCGGNGRCSTCRVHVTAGDAHCPPPGPAERATLDRIAAAPGVRLACQLRPTGDIAVVPLLAATGTAPAPDRSGAVAERDLVVVHVAWRNRGVFARGHLPQDVVYLSRLFVETVAGALVATGGTVGETRVDGVTALFGLAGEIAPARGHARAAAIAIDRALDALRRRYEAEFGAPAEFTVLLHEGPGAVGGDPSSQAGHLLAAGEAFDTIAALGTADLGRHAAIVVTARAAEGLAPGAADAAWRRVAPAGDAPAMRVAVFASGDALQRAAPA
jgi:adenylate cyclase